MIGRRERTTGRAFRAKRGRKLCIESLEQRLALTWAGTPPSVITPPTTAAAVTLNAQNDANGAATIATTEIDYYSFTARASGSYVISSTTPSSSVDTVLGIFSATGQRLAYNDDISYPSNTDSRVTINLTAGTRYYVGITNYTSSSRGSYSWSIDGPAGTSTSDDAYENNDSFAAAYNLGTPSATQTISNLVMADSQDWFRFTTSATGTSSNTVSISFVNSQGNLQLALYNSSGALLATSAGTGNSESISLSGRAAGTYYVDVYGNSGATNPNYALTITPPTVVTPPPSGGFQITLSMSGLTTSQQAIFQQAASNWAQVITGDLPNATYNGQTVDDLLINASARTIDGAGGVLGQAGPDRFRSGSSLPYHGVMEFDSADMASMQQSGALLGVVEHEIGHILGIGTLWSSRGLLSGTGGSNPIFVGAQATAAYNQIFGTSASGVPVEAGGGGGTALAHWRDSIFTNELMTGWAGPGTNLPLSRITVGSLADIGYTVNMAAADPYTPSSSSIAAARQASGGSGAAVRLVGNADSQVERVGAAGLSARMNRIDARRASTLPESYVYPIESHVADAVMAESEHAADEATAHSTLHDTTTCDEADQAWDHFESSLELWPALSLV